MTHTASHGSNRQDRDARARHVIVVGPFWSVATRNHIEIVESSLGVWSELAVSGTRVTRIVAVRDQALAEEVRSLSRGKLEMVPLVGRPRAPKTLMRFPALTPQLASLEPDVVHCTAEPWQLSTSLAMRAARELGVARGVHFAENGPAVHGARGSLQRRMGAIGLRAANYAIGWSQAAATVARSDLGFRGRVHAFPAVGVPDAFFQIRQNDRHMRPVVAFVGRLSPEKGVDDALAVARQLSGRGVQFVMVGDGPQRAMVREAHSRGIVQYLGPCSRTSVAEILGQATVTLVPSRPATVRGASGLLPIRVEEQFGLVIAESMAAGTPVVAYQSGSVAETIGPGGLLRNVGDVSGLSEDVMRLVADEALWRATSHQGRRWAAVFHESEIARRLTALWDDLA